jgi:hypothetical protein
VRSPLEYEEASPYPARVTAVAKETRSIAAEDPSIAGLSFNE